MFCRIAIAVLAAAAAAQPVFAQSNTDTLADDVEARVIAWRRHIHQNAELSIQEVKTAAYVAEALRAMPGLEVQTGIAKTGIKAVLKGGKPGPVVFFFRPAEEGGGGAFEMVKEGAMQNPKVDAVFGQHVGTRAPGGVIAYRRGSLMASSESFHVTVKGVSGHGAMPWSAKDPILTAAQIVTGLQAIVSRQADLSQGAAVVTVGQIAGGNRNNIIPEQATLSGTIRTLNEPTRLQIHEAVQRTVQKTAEAAGLTAEVKVTRGYPVLSNDPALTTRMLDALGRATGPGRVVEIPPVLGSEDFGAFSQVAQL